MRFDPTKLPKSTNEKLLSEFFKAATLLDSYQEVKAFFQDLLTDQETAMLARRLMIARLLLAKKTYREISQTLKIGLGTIARVQNWLKKGGRGYRLMIQKIRRFEETRVDSKIDSRESTVADIITRLALEKVTRAILEAEKKKKKQNSIT